MLASGIIIKDKAEDATYVVEVRTGSVGTNRQDLLFGIPLTTLPTVGLLPTGSATIPEIALVKRTNQQGVCKIAAFAYDRMSGRPVWQSGNRQFASRAKDIWVAGAGPFQKGTIYEGTAFAGERINVPLVADEDSTDDSSLSVSEHKIFHPDNPAFVQKGGSNVNNAGYTAPLPPTNQPNATPAAATSPATGTTPAAGATPAAGSSTTPAAGTPANNSGAAAGATPATSTDPPPKAAYTPPPTVAPAAPPPVPPAGPQGNLTQTSTLQPTSNPAEATAGAIQTYNIARGIMDRPK